MAATHVMEYRLKGIKPIQLILQVALTLGLASATTGAFATAFNVIGVQNFASSPSHLGTRYRDANGVLQGTRVAEIQDGPAGASGTFINGVLNLTLLTTNNESVTISSGMNAFEFEGSIPSSDGRAYSQLNDVDTLITLPDAGLAGFWGSTDVAPGGDYEVSFLGRDYGYPNPLGPNSFGPDPDNPGTFLLTLWGGGTHTDIGGRRLSADISIIFEPMAAVPIPAAFVLFGTALLGLFGFRRKRAGFAG